MAGLGQPQNKAPLQEGCAQQVPGRGLGSRELGLLGSGEPAGVPNGDSRGLGPSHHLWEGQHLQ